jgi:UPF0176 protein
MPASDPAAAYKLLYYVYADLGEEGRSRVCLALQAPAHPALSGHLRCGLDGLNGSLGGPRHALEAHAARVAALPDLSAAGPIDFKYAPLLATRAGLPAAAFAAYRVLAVEEIVTLGAAARGERAQGAARHAPPAEFHALLTGAAASAQGSVLIDCRNAFESDIGTLVPAQGSNLALLRPAVRRFEDMVAWTEAHAEELARAPRIAMFCTGGVRCERYSALVRSRFAGADVVQLEGGLQRYMEAAEAGAMGGQPPAAGSSSSSSSSSSAAPSRWQGRLYVFDERPAVHVAGEAASNPHLPGVLGACAACSAPQDEYTGHRCARCRVLVLVCAQCREGGGGEAAGQALVCSMCRQGVAWERARTRVRGRRQRQARPDKAAEAALRRAAGSGAGRGEGEEDSAAAPALGGLFGEAEV